MKASLDTNIIIHLYKANQQHIIFDLFTDGVVIYEFLVTKELITHGQDILPKFMKDVRDNKIEIVKDENLKEKGIYGLFSSYVDDEKILYNSTDLGEVYAIALARVLGAMALITDDIKNGGPHATLIRLPESDVVPFSCCEMIFLLVLEDKLNTNQMIEIYLSIMESNENYKVSIKKSLMSFEKRFSKGIYSPREKTWMEKYCSTKQIDYNKKANQIKQKIIAESKSNSNIY